MGNLLNEVLGIVEDDTTKTKTTKKRNVSFPSDSELVDFGYMYASIKKGKKLTDGEFGSAQINKFLIDFNNLMFNSIKESDFEEISNIYFTIQEKYNEMVSDTKEKQINPQTSKNKSSSANKTKRSVSKKSVKNNNNTNETIDDLEVDENDIDDNSTLLSNLKPNTKKKKV